MARCHRISTCHVLGRWLAAAAASASVAAVASPAARAADCVPPAAGATSYTANGCDATIAGGTFDNGDRNGEALLQATNNGTITVMGPVTLSSGGDEASGAYVHDGGAIRFTAPGSTMTMLGAHSNGVHAFGAATISGQATIITSGERGHAVFADYGGIIQLQDSAITTHGADAAGVAVAGGSVALFGRSTILTTGETAPGAAQLSGNSSIEIDGQAGRASITTTGMASPGAAAVAGGTLALRNVDVRTEGRRAFGLLAEGEDALVTATGTSVVTTGPGAHGLQLVDGASLTFRNGSVSTTGLDASALSMSGASDSTTQSAGIAASTLSSSGGAAIVALGGTNDILIADSRVVGNRRWLGIDAMDKTVLLTVTAVRSTLEGAAEVRAEAGAPAHQAHLTLRDQSLWRITGNSNLTTLDNRDSTVAFAAPTDGTFHTLTLNRYASTAGTMLLTSALGGDGSPSDRLVIDGGSATGATSLRIVNAGGKGALTQEGIRVIEAINGGSVPAGTFVLAGRAVAGPYEYHLFRGGLADPDDGNWYLRSQRMPDPPPPPDPPNPPDPPAPPAPPSPPRPTYRPEVPAYIANEHAAASLFLHSLHDRMGELSFSSAPAGWLRLVGKTAESGSRGNDYSARADTVILHGGGDLVRGSLFGTADRLHLGAMFGYGNVRTDGLAAGNQARARGEVNGYGAGMYATWFGHAASDLGPYVDSWFQYTWFDSNVRGDQLPRVGYHSQAWNVSVEGGWALPLAQTSWRVEPQAQVVWLRHRGVSVTEPGGTQINGGDTKGVVTRLGVRVFQTLEREEGGKLQPYATLNWWHDQASTSVGFSDTVLGQLFPRDRYELKLGIGARLARGWSSWGNVGGQWGGQGYRQYALRLGARYAW